MSSQLAAQLRILSGAGGATTTASKERRSVVASSASLAAIHHAAPGSTASKFKASFLFRADVAAATDSATIHSMGVSGMEQLLRLEPRLKGASAALFQAHSFDRESHNQQQLAHIQTQVNQCIRLLAPYFMIKPTHKVLEFLIRRYSIHIYNISALLSAFLPYHDSPLFARLTQILQIQLSVTPGKTMDTENNVNTNKLFGFLEASQREGTASITRHTLVQRCLHDAAFLQWIIQLVSLKHAAHLSNTTITFYTSMILELLTIVRSSNNANNAAQADSIVHVIVMHSVEVLNAHANAIQPAAVAAAAKTAVTPANGAHNRELFYATLLILTQISQITQLNSALLDSIVFLLCKSLPAPRQDQTLLQPILLTMVSLSQNQNIKAIVPKALDSLLVATGEAASAATMVRTLVTIAVQYDITTLVSILLPQIADVHQDNKAAHQLLCEMVAGLDGGAQLALNEHQIRSLVQRLLSAYVTRHESASAVKWDPKEVSSLRQLVLLIQEKYSSALEKVVQELIQQSTTSVEADEDEDEEDDEAKAHKKKKSKHDKRSNPLLSLIHLLFEGSSQEILDLRTMSTVAAAAGESAVPSAGSILTCLNSPLSHIRIQAIQAVDQLCAESKSTSSLSSHLRTALVSRLQDSEPAVIRALLKVKSLVKLLPSSELLDALVRILGRVAHTVEPIAINRDSGHKVIESVFKLAGKLIESVWSDEATVSIDAQAHELHAILHALGPFIFEYALLRPGVSRKIASSVHDLVQLLGSKADATRHHGIESGLNNGFDLCALFTGVESVVLPEDVDEAKVMKAYNEKLVAALVANFVRIVANHAAHPNSTVLRTIEVELSSTLERTNATVAAFTQSTNNVGGAAMETATPNTAFVVVHMLTQVLTQLATAAPSKKAGASSDAVFVRLMSQLRAPLARTWSSFTATQRQDAAKSTSVSLPSPASFINSAASFTPVSFAPFVRSTFAVLLQTLDEFREKHASSDEAAYAATLRAFFTFFLSDAESVSAYGVHLALLCKLHLNGGGLQETIRFLLPILQGASGVSLSVVVRSYHLLHALLSNHASARGKSTKEEQQVLQDLTATFVLGIASPSRAIRHAAMMASQALSVVVDGAAADKKAVSGASLKQLLTLVLAEKDEFLSAADGKEAAVDTLVESSTDASLTYVQNFMFKQLSAESTTSPFKADARVALHQFLVSMAIKVASSSVSAALRLLQIARKLPSTNVSDIGLAYLASLLADAAKATTSHADIVVELLQLVDVAGLKADNKRVFDVITTSLTVYAPDSDAMEDVDAAESAASPAASRHATTIRRAALARLSPAVFNLLSGAQQEQLFETLLSTLKRTDGVAEVVAELKFESEVFAKRLVLASKKKKESASASQVAAVQVILELLQLKDPQRTLQEPFALVTPLFTLLAQLNGQAQSGEESSTSAQQAVEYAKQLTMAVLMRFIGSQSEESEEEAVPAKKGKKVAASRGLVVKDISVDAVVACLGAQSAETAPAAASAAADTNTALHTLNVSLENTRTHALNLLSVIGKRHPELIVDVLIPIFQSLLQQSNEGDEKSARNAVTSAMAVEDGEAATQTVVADAEPYAFTLLNKLISTVLPSIIQAKLQWNVWQLMSVFVDSLGAGGVGAVTTTKKKKSLDGAATSVAARRRLKLFRNLITSLHGPLDAPADVDTESDNYLHVVLSLLIAKSVTDKASKRASPTASIDFAHLLAEQFGEEPVFQIVACNNLLHMLAQVIDTDHADLIAAQQHQVGAKLRIAGAKKPSKAAAKKSAAAEQGGVTHLSTVLRTPTQQNAWQRGVVSFISSHLSRLSFAKQIFLHGQRKQREIESNGGSQQGDEDIQASFLSLFEKLFARLRQALLLSKHLASDESNDVLANHFLLLSTQTNQALLHLNGLLTMENFIRILKELFRLSQADGAGARDLQLILQALALLNSKLISYKDRQKVQAHGKRKVQDEEDDDEPMVTDVDPETAERANFHKHRKQEQRLLISLLPSLEQLLQVEAVDASAAQNQDAASIKQSTLLNLEMLTSSFAHLKQFQGEFVTIVPTVLQLTLLPKRAQEGVDNSEEVHAVLTSHAWQNVATSALLCLSTLLSSFQEKANVLLLEHIPVLVPNTITILKEINLNTKTVAPAEKKPASGKRKRDEEDESESDDEEDALQTLDTLVAPLLQLSALSVLQASIVSVPEFLSPYLGDLLKVLLHPGYHNSSMIAPVAIAAESLLVPALAVAPAESSVDHSSVSTVVTQSINSLITLVPSRTLLPYIFNHYKAASAQGYSSLRRLFGVLGMIIVQFKSDNVKTHFKVIFKFFLAAAQQLRKKTAGGNSSAAGTPDAYGVTLSDAEDALIRAFLELTLKLNETSFKGLFLKMLQWVGPIPNTTAANIEVVDGPASTHEFLSRSLVFFKLIEQFSSKLKGIFVTYFGYILDHCIVFLSAPKTKKQQAIVSEDDDESEADEDDEEEDQPRKKQKNEDGATALAKTAANKAVLNAGISGGVSSELIDLVLHSLRNCFKNDADHFLDKYHFQRLTTPMVNQLQYAFNTRATSKQVSTGDARHASQHFDEFISNTLAPTIVEMAVRMGNYLQWKPLVSALLLHGRSSSPAVRRAAVYCFEQIFLKIGDNFLTVTPELLPWIAELLEDGDVGVERNVQKLVKIIERLSGESLDEALQG